MIGRTYSIVRSNWGKRTVKEVIATGLSWEEADSTRNELADADRAANPAMSSWIRDMFIVVIEPLPEPQQELFHAGRDRNRPSW